MRKLPSDLKNYFDRATNQDVSARELLCEAALSCIGIKEVGDNHGKMVEMFQSTVAVPVGQSWCLDFLQACIAYVEDVKKIQSPLPPLQSCIQLWTGSPHQEVVHPARGDIIIWELGDGGHGHCGLVLEEDAAHWKTVEGNTSDSMDIDRNGDGVYLKWRKKGGSKSFREVGFLKVFEG